MTISFVHAHTDPRTLPRHTTIAEAIFSEADEVGGRAIVLGTCGLAEIKSLWLGSVSHAVLQHADRPVIVAPSPEVAHERATHRANTARRSGSIA